MAPASSFAQAALTKLYKRIYLDRDLTNQSLVETPAFNMTKKLEDFFGDSLTFELNQDVPAVVASTKAVARANARSSKVDQWRMDAVKTLHSILTIDSLSMFRSEKDVGAFLKLKQKETDEAIEYFQMFLGGTCFWGDGAGDIGELAEAVTTASDTLVFTNPDNVVKVHLGMILVANDVRTGSGAGTPRTDRYEVSAYDRETGDVGLTRVTGTSDDWAIGDFVYQEGTRDAVPFGVSAFIPASKPGVGGVPTTLLNLVRTDDPVMKAGWRFAFQGRIETTVKYAIARMGRFFKQKNSIAWLSPINAFRLAEELKDSGQFYQMADASEHVTGSVDIVFRSPNGMVRCKSDPFCPNDTCFILDMSQVEVHHNRGLIHVVDDDGRQAVRMTDDDGIEIGLRSYSENIIPKPYRCARFPIPSIA